MATIVTRSDKGAPLTNAEVDSNFTNLNDDIFTRGKQYATRAAFIADTAYLPADGTVVTAGGVQYERKAGADVLPSLPGWVPFGLNAYAGHFGVVALDHGAPELSIADAVANAAALQTAIDETAASGKALLLPDGVIWVASYHIRKTGSVALGVDRAGGSVIKMHGAVRREMPLSISSTRNTPQKNINWSSITFDFNGFRRTSRFNTDQVDLYGAGNIITFTDAEREAEFGLATDNLLGTCFMVGDANDDWQWSEYRRIIAIDGERHSIDVSAPSDMRGSRPAVLGLPTGTATVYDPNPARFVKLIDCEAIGGNDDCITSHHCSHIVFERCIGRDATGDRVPGNANAIEIDDGSRNIWLLDCMGVRADCALQIKGHNDAPAPYNIYINNFVSINCRFGFELRHTGWYGLQPTDPDGEPVESVDEDGNPFSLTGASETARNVFVNGFHVVAPRQTNMAGTIRSAAQAYRLRSYENVILQNISFSDALSDLARAQDGYAERTTSTAPIMQINGGVSRLNVDGFTSRGGAERPELIRIFGTAGVGVKMDNIIATGAPRLGIFVSGAPASRIDLGIYDITGDWLDDPASIGVRFSATNSGSLGSGRVSGYTTEVTWPFSTTARSAAGGGVRGDFQVTGNVGIGTASPASNLQVGDGASAELGSTAPYIWVSARANSSGNDTTTPQELLRLSWDEESQDLGAGEGVAINFAARLIGDAAGEFQTVAQIASLKETSSDSTRTSNLIFSTADAPGETVGLTERMRISFDGKITASQGANWVGTVSQSGQSAIMQRGSNANGTFVRYADGTQICYMVGRESRSTTGVHNTAMTFPATFIDENVGPDGQPYSAVATLLTAVPATATSVALTSFTLSGLTVAIDRSTTTNTVFAIVAIGRWF